MKINDCHCHFFSRSFLRRLGQQAGLEDHPHLGEQVARQLAWEDPGSNQDLASRWIDELDRNQVNRMGLIASLPGEEEAVAEAVSRHPQRLVGLFMVDPGKGEVSETIERGIAGLGLRVVCLFPAMHHFRLDSDEALAVFEKAGSLGGSVFVHCGLLSVGVRSKLGLPSPFDMRLGRPLDLQRAASAFPRVPIIIPHFGAGFFTETLMLAALHKNIFVDTSSSNSWVRLVPGLTLEEAFSRAIEVLGPDRILFGTDSSFFPRGWHSKILLEQIEILQRLGVGETDRQQILSENFDRLYPLH